MIAKTLLTITAMFSCLLAVSVILSGAHATYALALNTTSNTTHQQTAHSRKSDDGGTGRVPSDPHNHVDKHSLKSLHKSVIATAWLTENRQNKNKSRLKVSTSLFRLFGFRLLESFGL